MASEAEGVTSDNLSLMISVIVFAIVYIQMFNDRRFWLGFEICLGIIGGAMVLFPGLAKEEKPDDLNTYLGRMVGTMMFGTALTTYLLEQSHDYAVGVSRATSQIISRIALTLLSLYLVFFQSKSIDNPGTKIFLIVFPLLIFYEFTNIPKLTRRYGSLQVGDPLSFHVTFDAYVTFIMSMLLFGFPEMYLYTISPDTVFQPIHKMRIRVVGGFYLGSALLSFFALTFRFTEDVKNVLRCKGTIALMMLASAAATMFYNNNFFNTSHLVLGCGVNAFLFINFYQAVYAGN